MANDKKFVVKNGLQTQNISFVDSSGNTITTSMLGTDTLSFSGDAGQLFSITDSLSGTIFAVNDISGVPSIEVDDDGTIRFAETFGNVLIGTAVDDGTNKLQVDGNIYTTSNLIVGGDLVINGTTTTVNTATLQVEDNNIVLNYGTGDTTSTANGAGITIQDAVDASTNATILWNTSTNTFDFSHGITATGYNKSNWDTAYGWGNHADAGYLTAQTAEVNDLSAAVTWTTVPDAYIAESSVTQHQAALSITESQISDLQSYLTSETSHADVLVDGDFTSAGFMKTDGSGTYSVDSNTYITSAGTNFTNTLGIHKTSPTFTINDTDATNATEQTGWISFQRQGTEKAWIGYGSSSNANFTIKNTEGSVTVDSGLVVNGLATVSNLTLANPGIGSTSTINFAKTSDTAQIRVTESSADATEFQFYMADNPSSASDKFNWYISSWQGAGSAWKPLEFSAYDTRINSVDTIFNGNLYIGNQPYISTGGVIGSVIEVKTGTLSLTADVSNFTGSQTHVYIELTTDGTTFTAYNRKSTSGRTAYVTDVAITGTAQAITQGITVTFSGTTGGVAGDNWEFGAWGAGIVDISTELGIDIGSGNSISTVNNTKLHVGNTSNSQTSIQIRSASTGSGYLLFADGDDANAYVGNIRYDHSGNIMSFTSGGTQRVRITSTGVDARTGGFLINGTEVIDSSRNLTNIGTINGSVIANWDTAYGWGNHADAGYLTSETSHADVLVDGDFTSEGFMKRGATAGTYSIDTNTYLTTTGKAADSDKLDGIDSTSFLRSDADDSFSGKLTGTGQTPLVFASGAEGSHYTPTESGVGTARYWLRFDVTDGASYPFLTNRTPSGDVVIKTGTTAGGAEVERIRFKGGDGTQDIEISNARLGIGTATVNKDLQVNFNNTDTTVTSGNGLAGGVAGDGLLIYNENTTAGVYANLDFRAGNADARIAYKYSGTTNVGDLHFITDNGGTPKSSLVIKDAGNINIPSGALQFNDTTLVDSSRNISNVESLSLEYDKTATFGNATDGSASIKYGDYSTASNYFVFNLLNGTTSNPNGALFNLNGKNLLIVDGLDTKITFNGSLGSAAFTGPISAEGGNSEEWNTAYGWGDHSTAGYLTSETSHADVVVDGDFTSNGLMKRTGAGTYTTITDSSANWDTAYGWGDHASAGYANGAKKEWTSLTGSSGDWFPLFKLDDANQGGAIVTLKTYAHTSVTFAVGEGYSTSNKSSISILNSTNNDNGAWAGVDALRIRQNGKVEAQLSWSTGPTVDIEIQIVGPNANSITVYSALETSVDTDDIVDSVSITTNGLMRGLVLEGKDSIRLNGTTVVDSSRNLTNIGNITSNGTTSLAKLAPSTGGTAILGVTLNASTSGAATYTTLTGISTLNQVGIASSVAKTADNVYGTKTESKLLSTSGAVSGTIDVTNMYGVHSSITATELAGSISVTNAYAAYLTTNIAGSPNFTNLYGLYIDNPTGSLDYAIYSSSGTNYFGGDVVTDRIRDRSGSQLVLAAGESNQAIDGATSNLTAEAVYTVAEGGLVVISSPDNWSSDGGTTFYNQAAWDARNTANICGSNGQSSFPAQISVTGHGNSSQWNTAYGWGDHSAAGYITGITSSDVTTALGYTPYQENTSLTASDILINTTTLVDSSRNISNVESLNLPYNKRVNFGDATNGQGYIRYGDFSTAANYFTFGLSNGTSTNPNGVILSLNGKNITIVNGLDTKITLNGNTGAGTFTGDVTGASLKTGSWTIDQNASGDLEFVYA